jgi:hypothetical protein
MLSKLAATIVLAIVTLGGVVAEAQPGNPYECRVSEVPTSWAFGSPPGTISQHSAIFGDSGQDSIDLQFRSEERKAISALGLILEYEDATGEIIDRIPVVAGASSSPVSVPPNVLTPDGVWKDALPQGGFVTLTAVKNGVRTGRCPVRAKVTFAKIRFADGSTRTFSADHWGLGPVPMMIPTPSESTTELPVEPPVAMLAKLKISSSGSVVGVLPEEAGNSRLADWIRARIGRWQFHPALLDGKPVDSELSVLFLIYAKGMTTFPETSPVPQPVTLIRFVWSDALESQTAAPDRLTALYGSLTEGSIATYPLKNFIMAQ